MMESVWCDVITLFTQNKKKTSISNSPRVWIVEHNILVFVLVLSKADKKSSQFLLYIELNLKQHSFL